MRTRSLAVLAVGLLTLVVGIGLLYAVRSQVPPAAVSPLSPTPTATATSTPTATVPPTGPTASPASGLVTHENPTLGYRISLPQGYRRSGALVITGPEGVGVDFYTRRTELEERELCLSRQGSHVPSREWASDVQVRVTSNVRGISLAEWIRVMNLTMVFTSVEPATVDGHETAKVVHQPSGDTAWYAIRANDRIYELRPELDEQPSQQPKGWLDQIAASFRAIAPEPFPTPTDTRTRCGN